MQHVLVLVRDTSCGSSDLLAGSEVEEVLRERAPAFNLQEERISVLFPPRPLPGLRAADGDLRAVEPGLAQTDGAFAAFGVRRALQDASEPSVQALREAPVLSALFLAGSDSSASEDAESAGGQSRFYGAADSLFKSKVLDSDRQQRIGPTASRRLLRLFAKKSKLRRSCESTLLACGNFMGVFRC